MALPLFFLCGLLMAFPGAILPAWGYHVRGEYVAAGSYFLAMNLGLLASAPSAPYILRRKTSQFVLVTGCAAACASFLLLAALSPPAGWYWRAAAMAVMGWSAGLMMNTAFRIISPLYERDAAATVNLAGVLFGLGCLVMALMVAGTFYVYTLPSKMILTALVPGFAAGLYARARFAMPVERDTQGWREVWRDVKSPTAIIFSLLLFFQMGNEWSLAGFLAIFLVQRLGASPSSALSMLAFYWAVLTVGRVAAQWLLPRAGHGKLLLSSAVAALLGCTALMSTKSLFGSGMAIALVAGGFAMIYPLVVEKIGGRFPDYHPGFYNGLFSLGVTGGLLAPWSLSFIVDWLGIQYAMIVPALGTFMVVLLVGLLWLETALTGAAGRRV